MGKPAVAIELTAAERRELEGWRGVVGPRKDWRGGRGLCCLPPTDLRTRTAALSWRSMRIRSASGGDAMRSVDWMG